MTLGESPIDDPDWEVDRRISERLERSWPAFFGRFGRLTPVQREVVEPVLDGMNILACAPTAAGKTEAACAPLLERFVGRRGVWTVLYISPTRALVNDLYDRLIAPVQSLGLKIARRTGDYHDTLDPVPHVLLTTPESFDSLMCRGRQDGAGHVLAHVTAAVLDEVHLMHGTARGEQLRWLLERLRRLRGYALEMGWSRHSDIQVVGLSATLPAPDDVLKAYFPAGSRLIEATGGRAIEVVPDIGVSAAGEPELVPTKWNLPRLEDAIHRYVAGSNPAEKILIFCNARKRVDSLAAEMAPALEAHGYVVRGHHGSLTQSQREAAEHCVKTQRKVILFATSTLEIGVDIGDIDLIVLDGPPPDMSAFLQRIGRGNRRTMKTSVMLCADDPADALTQFAMLAAARESYLGPRESGPQYAVGRQQLASYIFQSPTRERSEQSLVGLAAAMLPPETANALVNHMLSRSELVPDRKGIRLGDEWLDKTNGDIHSNIEGQPGYTVTDTASGDAIALGVQYRGGKRLAIAGNKLDVTRVSERHIEVRRADSPGRPDAEWSYALSRWVKGASQPQAVRRYLRFDENAWPVVVTSQGVFVFHFGGACRKACIELLALRAGMEREVSIGDYHLILPLRAQDKGDWLLQPGPAVLEIMISEHLPKLERSLARPRTNASLPEQLRIAEVCEWLNIPAQLSAIQRSIWVQVTEPHLKTALGALLSTA